MLQTMQGITQHSVVRLLQCCEKRIFEVSDGGNEFRSSSEFRQYLESMHKQLNYLTETSERLPFLGNYRERLQKLESEFLPNSKEPYLRSSVSSTGASPNVLETGSAHDINQSRSVTEGESTSTINKGGVKLLGRHKEIQEGLTDEMLELASGLKNNSLQLESEVRQAGKILESTESLVSQNLSSMQGSTTLAKEQHQRASRGSCLKWILILLVGVIFSSMALLIRLLSVKVQTQ